MSVLRVLGYAALTGARVYTAIYTWRSWLAGWFLRVVAQVLFFSLIGRLLGSDEQMYYLLVGNAVMLAAMQGIIALNLVTNERDTGTLPLLAASPTSAVLVFAARGAYLILDGLVSSLGALLVAGALVGLPLPWPRCLIVAPLTLLVAASTFAFGTVLAGLLIRIRQINAIVSNVTITVFMTVCGVNVPLTRLPTPVAAGARLLPLTHGLAAVRAVLAGRSGTALVQAGWEATVGAGWLVVAVLTFGTFVRHGRRDGSLDFS
jgi:ABC-2 type transport system permease protein